MKGTSPPETFHAWGAESSQACIYRGGERCHSETTMFPNPILSEMIARERFKDYLREAEQSQLADAVITRQLAHHFDSTNFPQQSLNRC